MRLQLISLHNLPVMGARGCIAPQSFANALVAWLQRITASKLELLTAVAQFFGFSQHFHSFTASFSSLLSGRAVVDVSVTNILRHKVSTIEVLANFGAQDGKCNILVSNYFISRRS